MKAIDFTRNDCRLGQRRISYARLEREYRCQDCGGRIVVFHGEAGAYAACGICGGQGFIHEQECQRQKLEALEVLEGLPPEFATALGYEQVDCGPAMLRPLGLQEPMEI